MRVLRTVLVAAAVALVAAPAAGAAEAVVSLQVTGAGTMRFDLEDGIDRQSPEHFGRTCGGAALDRSNLFNPTGVRQHLCTVRFTVDGCPEGQSLPCDWFARVDGRKPNSPQLTNAEASLIPPHWLHSGFTQAPAGCQLNDGTARSCTFKVASCTVDGCSYEPTIGLTFAFRDVRPPVASFACRLASGAFDPSSTCAAKPPAMVTSPTGTVGFRARSDEYAAGEYSRLECRLDGGAWEACPVAPGPVVPGTFAYSGVSDGAHVVEIRAIDPSANTGPETSTTFTQRYPPVTTITGGPAEGADIAVRKPEFTFAADRKATFECRFDDQAWTPCAERFSPAVSLTDGPHTFSVRAKRPDDEGGVAEADPPVRSFTVDLAGPEAFITGGPEEGLRTTSRTATFSFVTDPPEPGVTFRCQLDANAAEPCDGGTVTYPSLPAGRHTFTLTAFDRAGNGLDAPLTRSWTVIADADGDGFFAPSNDCDDANPSVRPGALEIPGNGIDEDCDGTDPPNLDLDGDGALAPPQGRDCDDGDPARHPGAPEVVGNGIDEDCDGEDPVDRDRDDDGVLAPPVGGDCNDEDAGIRPGAKDVPENGIDEDCDEVDASFPRIGMDFRALWQPFPRFTQVVAFDAVDVPAGTVITFRCRGGCEKSRGRIVVRRKRAKLHLVSRIGRRMRPGAVLEVRVANRGHMTEVHRWRFRAGKAPTRRDRCVRLGKAGPC